MKRIFLPLLILSLFFSAGTAQAFKIDKQKDVPVRNDFELGPTAFKIKAKKGESFTKRLEVTNRLGRTMGFRVEVEDFVGSNNPLEPTVLNNSLFGATKWFSVDQDSFVLKHGERAYINVTVKIPRDADAGEHYSAVLIRNVNQEKVPKGSSVIGLVSRLGSMFLINVDGKKEVNGSLTDFRTSSTFYQNGPVKFGVVVANRGTVHLEPKGSITIRDSFGKVTAVIPVKKWIVLRQSKRMQEAVLDRYWLFGKYTATADVGWGNQHSQAKLVFYAFPVATVFGILAAIFVIMFFVIYMGGKYKLSLKVERK